MAPAAKRALWRIALVAVLAAVLALLAVLQYRWSLEISNAERARIVASLNTSVNQFRQEFYRAGCAGFHRISTAIPQPNRMIFGQAMRIVIRSGRARLRVPTWWPTYSSGRRVCPIPAASRDCCS